MRRKSWKLPHEQIKGGCKPFELKIENAISLKAKPTKILPRGTVP